MTTKRSPFFIAVMLFTIITARCTTATDTTSAAPLFVGETLVDPQLGYDPLPDSKSSRAYAKALSFLRQGQLTAAEEQLDELLARDPAYGPALLLRARLALQENDLDTAEKFVQRAVSVDDDYLAAQIYRAEIAAARGDERAALNIYSSLDANALPAASKDRMDALRTDIFGDLVQRGTATTGDESVAALREALAFQESEPVRILLARRLVELDRFEDARRELEPVISAGGADRDEVQELLAEVDVSRQRYQEAIARLERIARRNPEPRYRTRLNEVKRLWNETNMPPQYQKAIDSAAITRADLAVLIFWKVSQVRFARSVGQPPIAVDIADVPGREELVRAMALGLFSVDPLTRSVSPDRVISSSSFLRIINRLFVMRGSLPECGKNVTEIGEVARAESVLRACGVDTTPLQTSDAVVSGAFAANVLQRVDALLSSAK